MLPKLTLLVSLVAALAGLAQAKSSTGDSVLVVVEPSRKDNFSIFYEQLKEQGYELTFRGPKEDGPALIADDVPSFSHVAILATETKTFAQDITPQLLVQLLEKDTNLLLALSQKSNPVSSLASEFSLILPPPNTPLLSYFPERDEPATQVPVPVFPNSIVSPSSSDALVWFSGVPFALASNPLVTPILRAPTESFAADTDAGADALIEAADKGGEGLWAGSNLAIAAGFQTLSGGARAVWLGGSEMLADDLIQKPGSAGKEFAKDVFGWAFQEKNVLRIDRIEHHPVNGTEPKEAYTIKDEIEFSAFISKYNPTSAEWEPYSGISDLQLEFTMLDPHIRTSLPASASVPGQYTTTFRAPDRHGVFKFIVDYRRKGLTRLYATETVPVVPPRHDGYPRFLSAAWPYYVGAMSTSVGFVLFAALWLAGEAKVGTAKAKGKKSE